MYTEFLKLVERPKPHQEVYATVRVRGDQLVIEGKPPLSFVQHLESVWAACGGDVELFLKTRLPQEYRTIYRIARFVPEG
jgi:hypothetical protein